MEVLPVASALYRTVPGAGAVVGGGEDSSRWGKSLLRWQLGNVELDRDQRGYIMPRKPSHSATIDTAQALVMAMSQAVLHGITPKHKPEFFFF
jgi:phage terminase large subunit-like protein